MNPLGTGRRSFGFRGALLGNDMEVYYSASHDIPIFTYVPFYPEICFGKLWCMICAILHIRLQ